MEEGRTTTSAPRRHARRSVLTYIMTILAAVTSYAAGTLQGVHSAPAQPTVGDAERRVVTACDGARSRQK